MCILLPSDGGPPDDILLKLHLWKLSGVHSASSPENFQLLSLAVSIAASSPPTSCFGVDHLLCDPINGLRLTSETSCCEDAETALGGLGVRAEIHSLVIVRLHFSFCKNSTLSYTPHL